MIRAKIIAKGAVQKVGYRDIVQEVAIELGVKGFVENLRDGSVGITCEAEEVIINKFVTRIKIKKDFIDVKALKIVEKAKPTGEFGYFDIKYGRIEEELGDRLGAAIKYAGGAWGEVKGSREDIKGVREEVKGSREDIKGVREEVKGSREDIRAMHKDMNKRFELMAKRYDLIAKGLERGLAKIDEGFARMEREFIKSRKETREEFAKSRKEIAIALNGFTRVVRELMRK